MAVTDSVNENYSPNDVEERVLKFMKDEPCGRVTNRWVREQTGMAAERVDPALRDLAKAGWVERLTRGFYELDKDPRED